MCWARSALWNAGLEVRSLLISDILSLSDCKYSGIIRDLQALPGDVHRESGQFFLHLIFSNNTIILYINLCVISCRVQ